MHPFWRNVFDNDLPVEIEIGPGTGTFLLAAAARHTHTNFFGIERSYRRALRLADAVEAGGRRNTRVLVGDAACIITTLVPAASVAAYHIYFPDPWWKRRHHRRRLFTPTFAAALARTLVTDGRISLATDVDDVFTLALKTLQACDALVWHGERPPPRPNLTAFERKGLARGATIKEATFIKSAADTTALRTHTNNAAPITPAESPS